MGSLGFRAWGQYRLEDSVDDIKVALHIFLVVLILGTGWRLTSAHLIASQRTWVQHLGKAMSVQYG